MISYVASSLKNLVVVVERTCCWTGGSIGASKNQRNIFLKKIGTATARVSKEPTDESAAQQSRAVLRRCLKAGEVDSSRQPEPPGRNVAEFHRNTHPSLCRPAQAMAVVFLFWGLAALNSSKDSCPQAARRMSLAARISSAYRLGFWPPYRGLSGMYPACRP